MYNLNLYLISYVRDNMASSILKKFILKIVLKDESDYYGEILF